MSGFSIYSTNQMRQAALMTFDHPYTVSKDPRMGYEIRTPMNAIIGMTTIAAAYLKTGSKWRTAWRRPATSPSN